MSANDLDMEPAWENHHGNAAVMAQGAIPVETGDNFKRKPNFSDVEKMYLVREFAKFKQILGPKLGDAVSLKKKMDIWVHIAEGLNHHNPLLERTAKEVRKKWENLLSMARKELNEYRSGFGRSSTKTPSVLTLKILELADEITFNYDYTLDENAPSTSAAAYYNTSSTFQNNSTNQQQEARRQQSQSPTSAHTSVTRLLDSEFASTNGGEISVEHVHVKSEILGEHEDDVKSTAVSAPCMNIKDTFTSSQNGHHSSMTTGHSSMTTGHSSMTTGHSSMTTGHSSMTTGHSSMTNGRNFPPQQAQFPADHHQVVDSTAAAAMTSSAAIPLLPSSMSLLQSLKSPPPTVVVVDNGQQRMMTSSARSSKSPAMVVADSGRNSNLKRKFSQISSAPPPPNVTISSQKFENFEFSRKNAAETNNFAEFPVKIDGGFPQFSAKNCHQIFSSLSSPRSNNSVILVDRDDEGGDDVIFDQSEEAAEFLRLKKRRFQLEVERMELENQKLKLEVHLLQIKVEKEVGKKINNSRHEGKMVVRGKSGEDQRSADCEDHVSATSPTVENNCWSESTADNCE